MKKHCLGAVCPLSYLFEKTQNICFMHCLYSLEPMTGCCIRLPSSIRCLWTKHTRCNSASNKNQQFHIILLCSLCFLENTSDAAGDLTINTTAAVGWVGFSSINFAPVIFQLLHSLSSNASLLSFPHSSAVQRRGALCYALKCTLQL